VANFSLLISIREVLYFLRPVDCLSLPSYCKMYNHKWTYYSTVQYLFYVPSVVKRFLQYELSMSFKKAVWNAHWTVQQKLQNRANAMAKSQSQNTNKFFSARPIAGKLDCYASCSSWCHPFPHPIRYANQLDFDLSHWLCFAPAILASMLQQPVAQRVGLVYYMDGHRHPPIEGEGRSKGQSLY